MSGSEPCVHLDLDRVYRAAFVRRAKTGPSEGKFQKLRARVTASGFGMLVGFTIAANPEEIKKSYAQNRDNQKFRFSVDSFHLPVSPPFSGLVLNVINAESGTRLS